MLLRQLSQLFSQVFPHDSGTLNQIQSAHLVNGGNGRSKRHRMRLIGMTMGEIMIVKIGRDTVRGCTQPQWNVGGSDALGRNQDVWLNIPVMNSEPFARRPPATHHFVCDQQYTVPVADLAQPRKVLG